VMIMFYFREDASSYMDLAVFNNAAHYGIAEPDQNVAGKI